MSSEIFYDKAFIKVGCGYIPLVNHGASNCFAFTDKGQEVPDKIWSVLNYPFPGRFIFTPDEIQIIATAYEAINTSNRGGIMKSENKAFGVGRFKAWIISGMRYARTVEEYVAAGNQVQIIHYSDYSRHSVKTNMELLGTIDRFSDKNDIGITFYDDRAEAYLEKNKKSYHFEVKEGENSVRKRDKGR